MKKVTIEFPLEILKKIGLGEILSNIKRCEVIHTLKYDDKSFVSISKIEMLDSSYSAMDLVGLKGIDDIEVLHEENGIYTCIVKERWQSIPEIFSGFDILLDLPLIYNTEKCVCSFVVREKDVEKLISSISELGTDFKIIKVRNIGHDSVKSLPYLTDKQKKVVILAKKLGYFEIPRRVSSEKLAEILGVSQSAVLEHLRKAERSIFDNLLD